MTPDVRRWLARWHRRTPNGVAGRCGPACDEGLALDPSLRRVVGFVSDAGRTGITRFLGMHVWLTADGAILDPTVRQYAADCAPGALRYHPFLAGVHPIRFEDRITLCRVCWKPQLSAGLVPWCFCNAGPEAYFETAVGARP